MSYILDALNKSEEEKKQHVTPGLNTIHHTPGRHSTGIPSWVLICFLALLISLIGFGTWYILSVTNSTRTVQASPSLEQNTKLNQTASSAATTNQAPTAKTSVNSMPLINAPIQQQTSALVRSAPRQPIKTSDPSITKLPPLIKKEILAIRFSSHIFATDPTLRMVIINNQRLMEGDRFGSGIWLQQITDEGVVIKYEDTLIAISVLSQWADD
jgi:general secretion pathway protein B